MQYFQAVRIGKERSGKSQMILFNLGGFAMLTLTTKKKDGVFLPVGEQNYAAIIQTSDGYVTILVDEDGYTKAQSKPLQKESALELFKKVKESGIEEFTGVTVEIWTEQYRTVQKEL
ncbi:MAG: hypothetical protein ACKO7N_05595 [Candidatus Nitrosotenuis sp.]